MRTMCRSRWFLPLFAVALGAVVFGAQAIGGHAGSGLVSFGIMAAVGAVFLFGGRSETIRGLRGDGRDERFHRMDVNATAFAGTIVIFAVIVAVVVELAKGKDPGPYGWLAAVGGLSYIVAIVAIRLRG